MIEIKTELKIFQVDNLCDKCKEQMEFDSSTLTFPMNYKYKCPKCGYEEVSQIKYPYMITEKICKEDL